MYGLDAWQRTAGDPGDPGFDPPGDAQHAPFFYLDLERKEKEFLILFENFILN
jgi:hypothetical protein